MNYKVECAESTVEVIGPNQFQSKAHVRIMVFNEAMTPYAVRTLAEAMLRAAEIVQILNAMPKVSDEPG